MDKLGVVDFIEEVCAGKKNRSSGGGIGIFEKSRSFGGSQCGKTERKRRERGKRGASVRENMNNGSRFSIGRVIIWGLGL